MKIQKLLLVLMVFLVAGCKEVTLVGTIVDKKSTPAYTEDIPAGYRTDCGLTIQGKYECGFKFFYGKQEYHPAQYLVTFELVECNYQKTWNVSENEYNSSEIGDITSVVVWDTVVPKECLPNEN